MNFTIRQATAFDAKAASHLVTGLAHYFLANPASAQAAPFMAGLSPSAHAERLSSSQFKHYVAEDAAGLCGVVALRDGSHVYHLFVRVDAQGRGIARALWLHAKQRSSQSTFTVNASLHAVPVYERLGFVAVAGPQRLHGVAFVPMVYAHE
ncbi:MAG: GNAT family N-acetyltransferase [Comamonas sp.]|jgi:GNAT superfamily N-acetyltransferase|nr:GNAT family N-acetyltransferase [Comamonas sp.]